MPWKAFLVRIASRRVYIATMFFLIFSSGISALQEGKSEDPSIGVHGMALMRVGPHIIASHMPLLHSKHEHQLLMIVQVDTADREAVGKLLEQAPLVSLQPDVFSLQSLLGGKLSHINAEVYNGHFEREGSKQLENVKFKIAKQLLNTHIVGNEKNGLYYLIALDTENVLLAHRIGKLPSFDQIVWLKRLVPLPLPESVEANISEPLNKQLAAPLLKALGLQWRQQLYLETADFQK